jgi:hypothetical protein
VQSAVAAEAFMNYPGFKLPVFTAFGQVMKVKSM